MADANNNIQNSNPENPAPSEKANNENQSTYRVKIIHSSATEICVCDRCMEVERGDKVVVPTRYGKELGSVQGIISDSEIDKNEVQIIDRKATTQDIERFEANAEKDKKAFEICREKIVKHGLDMKLVSAHYLIDEAKILFYFTSDARVDFRELVKDLVSIFKMRIELRQIGVRDEARVLGGVGVCGRGYCCHCMTDNMKPVSIKMAKEQNLTLNSMKISGPCGRLLCCLSYEYDTYRDTKKTLPLEGMRIDFDNEHFRVIDINIFIKKIKLAGDSGRYIDIDFDRFIYDEEKEEWQILKE